MKAAKLFVYLFAGCFFSCAYDENTIADSIAAKDSASVDCMPVVARFASADSIAYGGDPAAGSHEGMVKLPGGTFMMGGNNEQASPDEFPRHEVTVAPF